MKPQPYETDLSYLEDQFELIETLLKARKSETNEDSYSMRPDQRKPEAVARELRAKARGLQARVQQRMETTHKNGGTCTIGVYLFRFYLKVCYVSNTMSALLHSIQSVTSVQGTDFISMHGSFTESATLFSVCRTLSAISMNYMYMRIHVCCEGALGESDGIYTA